MKKISLVSIITLVLMITFGLANASLAQNSPPLAQIDGGSITAVSTDYGFSSSSGVYTEITGGTLVTTSCDDNSYGTYAIGFSFTFNGTAYTTFGIQCNGFIAMSASPSSSYTPISSGATNNIISALGNDQMTGTSNSEIRYQVLGSTPNQMLVVQYKNFRHYSGSQVYNFQIQLFETSNVVQFVYGSFTETSTYTQQVGLRGASNADFNNRMTGTWAASLPGTVNSSAMTLSSSSYPASGLTYTWTPLTPHPVFDISTKSAPPEILDGDVITYTVHIVNSGNLIAAGAIMTDTLPTGTTYGGSVHCTSGACSFDAIGNRVLWNGTIAVANSVDITFGADTDGVACGTSVVNTAILNDPALLGGPVTKQASTTLFSLFPVFTESFDGVTFPPTDWGQDFLSGTSPWLRSTSGTFPTILPHSGAGMAYWNSFSYSNGISTRLYTPVLDLSTVALPTVKFWMSHDTGYPTNADRVQIQVSTDGGTTWSNVGSPINRYDATCSTPCWKQHAVALPTASMGNNVRIGFVGISAYGNNIYLDDVTVSEYVLCNNVAVVPNYDSTTCPGNTAYYPLTVAHKDVITDTVNLGVTHVLPTMVVPGSFVFGPVDSGSATASVYVPWSAVVGASDTATVLATAQTSGLTGQATIRTTVPTGCPTCTPISGVDFIATPPGGAPGVEITFNAVASGSPAITYAWDYGDTGTGTGQVVTHTFTTAGTYTVTLTASNCDGANISTVSHTVTIAAGPLVSVNPTSLSALQCSASQSTETLNICNIGDQPLDWELSEVPTTTLWLSESRLTGTLTTNTCQVVTVTFDSAGLNPGVYTSTLEIESNDVLHPVVAVPIQLTVPGAPTNVDFSWNPLLPNKNDAITFTGQAGGLLPLTYTWDFGDGITSTNQIATHAYNDWGYYTATMTVQQCDLPTTVMHTISVASCFPQLSENFEGSFPPTGWTVDNHGLTHGWLRNDQVPSGRPNYAGGDGYSADADVDSYGSGSTMDTELRSVTVDLSTARSAILQYMASYNWFSSGEYANTDISTDGGLTWSNLVNWTSDHSAYGPGESVSLDLPSYVGSPNTLIRFYYYAPAWDYWFQVDQVKVYGCYLPNEVPDIAVTPPSLEQTLQVDQTATQVLNIANQSLPELKWNLDEGCGTPVSWLSENPITGTVPANSNMDVNVTFNSNGLLEGTYQTRVCINSNDLSQPTVPVTVTMIVSGTPDINVTPTSLTQTLSPDQTAGQILNVANLGPAPLNWALAEGCDTPVPWLAENPITGTLPAYENTDLTVTFDSTGLSMGTYQTSLCVSSNDRDEPVVTIPVTLNVVQALIAVNPAALVSAQKPNVQATETFTISNTGNLDLLWTLFEENIPRNVAPVPAQTTRTRPVNLTLNSMPAGKSSSSAPLAPQGAVNLVIDDGVNENNIGISGTREFIFLNRFTPAAVDYPFYLSQVQVYFDSTGLAQVGDAIQLVVYQDADGDPTNGATLLGVFDQTVLAVDNWNTYNLPSPVLATGPGDVLIGVIALKVPGSSYWPAALDQTTSQQRSWAGWWLSTPPDPSIFPPDDTFILIDDYYPGNWLVRGYGETVPCEHPADIPWASVTPISGTVSTDGSQPVQVTFDSTGLAMGTYTANLCISSNDITNPQVTLPITMTVSPYVVEFNYLDLENVVHAGEAVYIAGSFNGWDPTATPLTPNADFSAFSVDVGFTDLGNIEYKYIVYTDTIPSGPANWNWLQSNNRQVTISGDTTITDYRNVQPGWYDLQRPYSFSVPVGFPSPNIYGQIWADDLTARLGAPRALLAEVGYGTDPDPSTWTTWQTMVWDSQVGNNDEFNGTLTFPVSGTFYYAVRYRTNFGAGNPYDAWIYADRNGGVFDIADAGVATIFPYEADLSVVKTASNDTVLPGDTITYTIVVSNSGPADAANVVLTDTLPAGVTFVSASSSCAEVGGIVSCDLGVIVTGNSVTAIIVVTAPTQTGILTNTVIVTSNVPDPDLINNTTSVDVEVKVTQHFIYLPLMLRLSGGGSR